MSATTAYPSLQQLALGQPHEALRGSSVEPSGQHAPQHSNGLADDAPSSQVKPSERAAVTLPHRTTPPAHRRRRQSPPLPLRPRSQPHSPPACVKYLSADLPKCVGGDAVHPRAAARAGGGLGAEPRAPPLPGRSLCRVCAAAALGRPGARVGGEPVSAERRRRPYCMHASCGSQWRLCAGAFSLSSAPRCFLRLAALPPPPPLLPSRCPVCPDAGGGRPPPAPRGRARVPRAAAGADGGGGGAH